MYVGLGDEGHDEDAGAVDPMLITRPDTSPHVGSGLSVGCGMFSAEMSRHTTFSFCLDPTVEQREVLARHAGAARFAFNQCLRIVKAALTQRRADSDTDGAVDRV